jgi:hypothetical protein
MIPFLCTVAHAKGIPIEDINSPRATGIFNMLMNERNIEYKRLEFMAHCSPSNNTENLNSLLTKYHNLMFPWKDINANLLDLLKNEY